MRKKTLLKKALSVLLSASLLGTALMSGYPVMTNAVEGDDVVNQDLTASVLLPDADTKQSGDVIQVTVNATNSSSVIVEDGTVYIDFIDEDGNYITDIDFSNFENDGDSKEFNSNGFTSNITYREVKDGGKVIRKYFTMTVPQGATLSYNIGMYCENGLTPNGKSVWVKASTTNPGDDAESIDKENTVKATWTAEFGWDDVIKTADTSKLGIINEDGKNILSGDINYTISNTSQNTDNYGEIWTKEVTITDILTLPDGISLPEGARVSDDGTKIIASDGTYIVSATNLDGGNIKFKIDGNKIIFTYTKANPNTEKGRLTAEMQNVNISINVKASQLEIDITKFDSTKTIDNHVEFEATSVFDDKATSNDDANVEINREAKTKITKTADKSDVESGDVVTYTITISNIGTKEITDDLVDKLPLGMTLTEEQKKALEAAGATVEWVRSNSWDSEPNTWQITWPNITLNPSESVSKTITATVKPASDIVKNNWFNNFQNVATYNEQDAKAWLDYHYGDVGIKKTSDNNGETLENGDIVNYTITVSNASEYDYKEEFTVTDTLPKGLVLVDDIGNPLENGATIKNGNITGVVTVSDGIYTVVWTFPDGIKKGTETKLTYKAKLDQSLISKGFDEDKVLTNTASLAPQGKNDSTDVTTHVDGVEYDKKIIDKQDKNTEKQACATTVGGAYTYVLRIINDTDNSIAGITAVDTLPNPNGKFNWEESLISIDTNGDFETLSKGVIYIPSNSAWSESTITWSGMTVPANTTLEQRITITWPAGENGADFSEYLDTFNNPKVVRNSFSVNGGEKVNADLTYKAPGDADVVVQSQKNVYDIYSGDTKTGRYKYYDGDTTKIQYVYSFYNTSNNESVIVEKAVDQLPAGQSYLRMHMNQYDGGNAEEVTTANQHGMVYLGDYIPEVEVKVKASYDAASRIITFTFFNKDTDEPLVLKAGTGFVLLYDCEIDPDVAMINRVSKNSIKTKVISDIEPKADSRSNNMYDGRNNYGNVGKAVSDVEQDLNGNEYWYESAVSIEPGRIIPGIVKKSVEYRAENGAWQSAYREVGGKQVPVTSMNPGDQFKWTITIRNEAKATASLIDYVIEDTPDAPYILMDDSDFGITVNGNTIPLSLSDETIVSSVDNEDGTKTYKFKFSGSQFKIEPGQSAVLTLITKNGSNVETIGTYYNDTYLITSQDFKKSEVEKGTVVGDKINSKASVNAFGAFGSFSYLTIHDKTETDRNCSPENENPYETGIGYDASDNYVYTNYPKAGQDASSVDYTIHMMNASKIDFEDIVIINKLPYKGDNGAVNLNSYRDSDFSVKLDPAKAMVIKVIDAEGNERVIDSSKYKIQYTSKGKEGYSENDWNGEDSEEWSDEITADTLSFRVVFDDDFSLKPDETITVNFHGILGDDAEPGKYAWDSFGYRYSATTNKGTEFAVTQTLTASPAKVGLRIPFSSYIKKVVKSGANELPANDDVKFTFKLYEVTDENEYTFVQDILVAQGSTEEINTEYFYSDGVFKQNSKFVLVEVPVEGYETTFEGTVSSSEVKSATIDGVTYETAYFFDLNDNDDISFTCTNTLAAEAETISKSVEKVWSDNNNQDAIRPDSIKVQLYANETAMGDEVKLNASNNWKHTWTDLPKYDNNQAEITYTVDEVVTPSGYTKDVSTDSQGNVIITNTYTPEKTEFSVEKVWSDGNNQDGIRPTSITVQLYADGVAVDGKIATLNSDNSWKYTWRELPKYNGSTSPIVYTAKETSVPDGYSELYEDTTGKTVITNVHTIAVTSVKIVKAWNDSNNQDGIRPDKITVQLKKTVGGVTENVGEAVEVKASENWTYEWTGLPVKENGQDIVYSVVETAVSGYDTDYSTVGNTITITNTYTPEKTEFSVEKIWSDGNNQDGIRPTSITVQLYADGVAVDGKTATLNADNGWKYTWTELPKYNGSTTPIVYTAKETSVPQGYTESYQNSANKTTITNTYTPEKTEFSVEKVWSDGNNQDGIRPTSITVQLKKTVGGVTENVGEAVEVKASENWTYEWTGLPVKENGQDIVYSVEETAVDGYSSEYTTTDKTITITNSHVPETTSVDVRKIWDDSSDKDKIRPDSVTVQLYKGNDKIGSEVVLNNSNGWKASWDNLPKYSNGSEIIYQVKEVNVPNGYSVSYEADGTMISVINTHKPATTNPTSEPTSTTPKSTTTARTKPSKTTTTTTSANTTTPKVTTTTSVASDEVTTTVATSIPLVTIPENPTPEQIRRTLAYIDELLKRNDLTDEQRDELHRLRKTLSLMLEDAVDTGTDEGKAVPICAGGILILLAGYSFLSRKKKFFDK